MKMQENLAVHHAADPFHEAARLIVLLADTNDCRAAPKTRRHEAAEVPEHAMADRRGEQACNADEAQLSPPSQVPFIPNRAS